MPTSLSAKKRLRQNDRLRLRNRAVRRAIKTQINRVEAAIAAGDAERSNQEFRQAVKKLDQAAAKRILHRNAVAHTKSRLAARLKAASASS